MKIQLVAIGDKMPVWVKQAFADYQKRLYAYCQFSLVEIPAKKRGKAVNTEKVLQQEAELMLAKVSNRDYCIALDVGGKTLSTRQLAQQLEQLQPQGQNLSILIGGPEGFASSCLQRANVQWSLSALTFPHPLVRVILAEQLYRGFSLLAHHPYHRE